MSTASPLERGRENVTEIVSILVTGLWMAGLVTGQSWWLAALLVGYIVVVPLTELLFDADDEGAEPMSETASSQQYDSSMDSEQRDALETLRERYARGDLTDEQFERKVERLLETETLEDVEDRASEPAVDRGTVRDDREREREFS